MTKKNYILIKARKVEFDKMMCSTCYCANYRGRKFHSKGALLILLWIFFFGLSVWSFVRLPFFGIIMKTATYAIVAVILLGLLFASGPLIGWLADARLGNYKTFKIGNVLIFLTSILRCIYTLVFENINLDSLSSDIGVGVLIIAYGMLLVGGMACLISTLKLGLDQMPDASSENITSFVAWASVSMTGGLWFSELVTILARKCLMEDGVELNPVVEQVLSILPAISASCMCSLLFFFSNWLTIEPRSPKALKAIYQVLKFAWKHKSPLNRSALTYWEENVPSRMVLGKSRFGGPFTTEQVEDVKTFFKILIFFFPIAIVSFSSSSLQAVSLEYAQTLNITSCVSGLVYSLGYSTMVSTLIIFTTYELIIYGLIRNKLPSILKRIGMTSFVILLVNTIFGAVKIAGLKYDVGGSDWLYMTYCIVIGPVSMCLMTELVEFICAQTPYNMRGLLTCYGLFTFLTPYYLGHVTNSLFQSNYLCENNCSITIQSCLSFAMSLIGFVFYCLLARWYKMRVRDEDYDVHRVVEEVYDRYLSTR